MKRVFPEKNANARTAVLSGLHWQGIVDMPDDLCAGAPCGERRHNARASGIGVDDVGGNGSNQASQHFSRS